MLLKKIKIKDFRQFKGEQEIFFSTDGEKNVTIFMGENGAGKTTFAQAFTWCLYGETDFDDKIMICKSTAQNMLPNSEEIVKVELSLVHNGIDYVIIREQRYIKDNSGSLKKPTNTQLKVLYKNKDGQQEFLGDVECEMKIKEILPKELSKYFFFDGERIGNMSKEIRRGKSQEFAQAVRGLLGLNAFTAALDHLKGRGSRNSVIRSYDESFDSSSDEKIAIYTKEIEEYEDKILEIDQRLEEIEREEEISIDKCNELNEKIKENMESEKLALEKEQYINKINELDQKKEKDISLMLKIFNNGALGFLAKKPINDALRLLSDADKLDKGIPDIHARTIEFLIRRGTCICGNKIKIGSEEYQELNKLLEFIPPKSIGRMISDFTNKSEAESKNADNFYEQVKDKFKSIRDIENDYAELEHKIHIIEEKLKSMEKIGELQKELSRYELNIRRMKEERENLLLEKGSLETKKDRRVTERNELTLKDEKNRKIELYKAYAEYIYNTLNTFYKEKENETRQDLEKRINEIFKNIYKGGLSLLIDEKYNIQVIVNEYKDADEYIETSTAQSISVIFAFISGVIDMARYSKNSNDEMLVAEPYPLVMDAPLSAFDKKRIETVCDVLPKVAEQVIIFIKDTDGEIAEKYMRDKVGKKYQLGKINELETDINEVI